MGRAWWAVLALVAASALSACVATPPPAKSPAAGQALQRENLRPGSRTWRVTRPAAGALSAYTSRSSVAPGGSLEIAVSPRADTQVTLEVFRLGWYSGTGGRSVMTVGPFMAPAQGTWSPRTGVAGMAGPSADGYLSLGWRSLYTLNVPGDWVSGYYLVKVSDAAGLETYAPFIVRDDRIPHDIVMQASVTTWQAYNGWGGFSLYGRYDPSGTFVSSASPGRTVSFDRPYENDDGAGFMVSQELPLVSWLEERGYDVAYVTDLDTDAGRPSWLPKVFISVGHDEYWSENMRLNVTDLRSRGTHLAFLGGNDLYWQTRLTGQRDGESREESRVTPWRSIGASDSALMGQTWAGVVSGGYVDMVITNGGHWAFAGTGLKTGDHLTKVVGYEADRVAPDLAPPGIEILAASPFTATDPAIGVTVANMSIYRAPSGSWVFSAGTIVWPVSIRSEARVAAITTNVLARMLADSALAARTRASVPTASPTPIATAPNANLFKNGQPLPGSDQLSALSAGMHALVVDDPTSLTGRAYRLDLATAASQARAVPIPVDPAATYCVAAQIRTDGAIQVRVRITWLDIDGRTAGPDSVPPLVGSSTYVESTMTAIRPPTGATTASLAVVGSGPGTAYVAAIRVERQSTCDAWRAQLQYQ
jgi:hypothetical protein